MAMIDGPRVPPASGRPAKQLVIFAHGYGSNGDDLIGLAGYLAQDLPDAAFASPNAPQPLPGYPGGAYQWFGLANMDLNIIAQGARAAAPVLDAFIDAELARLGLTAADCALVGFSQGTMMALHVGPRRRAALAGIVGYSGMLADEAAPADAATHPPILLVHGDVDPMIPVNAFHQAQASLTANGFAVETHVSRGLGHSIDLPGLQLGGRFLARVLAP